MALFGNRIALIMEGRTGYEREVLLGIREHAAQQPDWIVRLEPPGRHIKRFITQWQPAGILFQAHGLTPTCLRTVTEADCPRIHVSDSQLSGAIPSVGLDNEHIGRQAAEYFLDRRAIHFGFVGIKGVNFSRDRRTAFQERLRKAEKTCVCFDLPSPEAHTDLRTERQLRRWLAKLVKPTAVFAVHDECSLLLSTFAREEGIRVPEDLTILGVDDDSLLCELAYPKLSSIGVPARRIGRVAAEKLDGWIRQPPRDNGPNSILLPPLAVVTRQSTDINQTSDESVNQALQFIASDFHRRINVEDILREIGVSRRSLERKFRDTLGRSPLQELHRKRIEYSRYLLSETQEPLDRIAERCGFPGASGFVTIFKKHTGSTPGQFRKNKPKK